MIESEVIESKRDDVEGEKNVINVVDLTKGFGQVNYMSSLRRK